MLTDQILRKNAVLQATGLSKTQLDRLEERGDFPARRKITTRLVGWSAREVEAWIHARLHAGTAA